MLLDGAATGGQLMLMRSTLHEGDASPVHQHEREDEIFLVLGGRVAFRYGDEDHVVEAGGVAFLPRGVPHGYRCVSEEADMITIATPAGSEAFFRGAGHDRSTPKPASWELTPVQLIEAAPGAGLQILGPPIDA